MGAKNSEIKQRLREYTVHIGFSQRKFNKIINASDSFLKSDGGFNVDFLPAIKQNFTDLNMNWLVYNEGDMILTPEETKLEKLNLFSIDTKVESLGNEFTTLKQEFLELVSEKLDTAIKKKE
jgi:hypothetical protein